MKIWISFVLSVIFFQLLGCKPKASVNYMDRYHFADRLMRSDRDPLVTKMNDHAYFSRERFTGGRSRRRKWMRLQLKILQRLRFFCCFLFLVESRAFLSPNSSTCSPMLLKPIPSLVKSIFATASTASVSLVTHSLSGATTEIRSNQGSPISIEAGEPFSYQFFTYRYSAQSFRVTGLPEDYRLRLQADMEVFLEPPPKLVLSQSK